MIIKEYKFDDKELIMLLRDYFGSETHFREHKQHFHRSPRKTFFVALINNDIVAYCSLRGTEICDLTTLLEFRDSGVCKTMIKYLQNIRDHLTLGTSNEILIHIIEKQNFRYKLNRGRYKYYEWKK